MEDVSLEKLNWRRRVTVKGPLHARPGIGGIRPRPGLPQTLPRRPAPASGVQQTFDAGQSRFTDARELLVQKDARFRIQGKVRDAREVLNARKQIRTEQGPKVADARDKINSKRSAAASLARAATPQSRRAVQQKAELPVLLRLAGRTGRGGNNPRKRNRSHLDADEEGAVPRACKRRKDTAAPGVGQHTAALSRARSPPLAEVDQDDAALPGPLFYRRPEALKDLSRTSETKKMLPAEPVFSPLEGTKVTVHNLDPQVTGEDVVELFSACGALKRARLVHPGLAEVVFVQKEDAIRAYGKYNTKCLDGQPMKCNLHLNGSVITSDEPILLRLSDSQAEKKASSRPPAKVDPDTVRKALFKPSGGSASGHHRKFVIKVN